VTTGGVWIGNRIYWSLTFVTINNYASRTELSTPNITNYSRHKVFSVFTIRCLVAVSNGDRSPSSGFPNCLQTQPAASNWNTHRYITPAGTAQKTSLLLLHVLSLPGEKTCTLSCSLATAVVLCVFKSRRGHQCGTVNISRDNHVLNFYTNIYCCVNGYKDKLQSVVFR
jgi:hypothetical protein